MAKYNREFLVPYLQNICALHLAYKKVYQHYSSLEMYKQRLEEGFYSAMLPSQPREDTEFVYEFGGICSFIGLSACLIFSLCDNDLFSKILVLIFAGCPCLLAVFIYMVYKFKARRDFKWQNEYYQKELKEYKQTQSTNYKKASAELPVITDEIQKAEHEIRKIESALNKVYQADIIPSRYRDIYAAVYLYDWFSTSRADDLDMALNMFVLEEIKEKLDTIIERQSESLLNQRMMLANQQRSLEQQQRHSAMMRSKLNQIAASAEERNTYLSMIECNTAATAYFAAADYIRHL